MALKRVRGCYCTGEYDVFINSDISLCNGHVYKELGLISVVDIKNIVLGPFNFENYIDKFTIKSVIQRLKKIPDIKNIIEINLISLDKMISIQMALYDGVPYFGYINYENFRYNYWIRDGKIYCEITTGLGLIIENPNIDPIKKYLRNMTIQDHNDNLPLRSGHIRAR